MIHFLNVVISDKMNIRVGLTQIYGIGSFEALQICKKLGLNPRALFKTLNNQLRIVLANYIKFKYIYGFHLNRLKKQNIESLIKLRLYRGNRHYQGFLVRGQRSKNKKMRKHF